MKRLYVVALGLIFALTAQAQDSELRSGMPSASEDNFMNITIDPLNLVIGFPTVGVGFYLGDRVQLSGHVGYLATDEILKSAVQDSLEAEGKFTDISGVNIDMATAGIETAIAMTGSIKGDTFFLAPSVFHTIIELSEDQNSKYVQLQATNAKVLAGYQWVLGSSFNIRVGGGVTTTIAQNWETKGVDDDIDEAELQGGTGLALDFKLGMAF